MTNTTAILADAAPLLTTTLALGWVGRLLVLVFLLVSVVLVLTVLIQRPSGGGLSGAFGANAGGAGQTAFGTKTGDALTIATIIMFVVYLCFAISLNYVAKGGQTPRSPVPAATPPDGEDEAPADADAPLPADDAPADDAATDDAPADDTPAEAPPADGDASEPDASQPDSSQPDASEPSGDGTGASTGG